MQKYHSRGQVVVLVNYMPAIDQYRCIGRSNRYMYAHVKYTIASCPLFFGTVCFALGLSTSYFHTSQYPISIQLTSSFFSAATTTVANVLPSLYKPGLLHERLWGCDAGLKYAIARKKQTAPKRYLRQERAINKLQGAKSRPRSVHRRTIW